MNCLRYRIGLVALMVLSLHQVGNAQDRVFLKKAEQVQGGEIDGKKVTLVIGSVHYFVPEKNLDIFCDTTYVYREDELYILRGNVRLIDVEKSLFSDMIRYDVIAEEAYSPGPFMYYEIDSSRSLQANQGRYFYNKNILIAEENVVYTDSVRTLFTDTLNYYEKEKKIVVSGNITCFDYEHNAVATGQSGEFWEEEKYGILTGDPRIAVADTAARDSLYITGSVMEFFGDDSTKFIVSDSVTIQQGLLEAYCQQAIYDDHKSRVYLRINPEIRHGSTQIFGNEIDLVIQDETVTEVVVRDSAIAITDADTSGQYDLQNKLQGKTITIYLNGEEIYKIVAIHNAESEYYSFENSELKGKNVSSSGQIIILLEDGYMDEIKGLKGIVGKFIPKEMLPEVRKKQFYE